MPEKTYRSIFISDVHLGTRDCKAEALNNFLKHNTCETCLFLGDWHNHRASINIVTLNYSLRALEHMNDNFEQVYFIPGNHDLYYRDRRDIQSVEFARHLPRVTICNDWFTDGGVTIAPWLCGDDYKRLATMSGQYLFGHFELLIVLHSNLHLLHMTKELLHIVHIKMYH